MEAACKMVLTRANNPLLITFHPVLLTHANTLLLINPHRVVFTWANSLLFTFHRAHMG